jgi:hypothetical protein
MDKDSKEAPASVPRLAPFPAPDRQTLALERIADALEGVEYYTWAGLVTRIPNLPYPAELRARKHGE